MVKTSWVSPTDDVAPETVSDLVAQAWHTSDVNFTLTATDCGHGVQDIRYQIDSDPLVIVAGATAVVNITTEGCHTFTYYAVDVDGNTEAHHEETICIDKTPPVITINTPSDGAAYFQGASVIADYTVTDAQSGVDPATVTAPVTSGSPIDTSTLDANAFTVQAADMAGNTGSLTNNYTVIEDTTPPHIILTTPADWAIYLVDEAVTVDFSVNEGESEISSITSTLPNGSSLDTSKIGVYTFTVDATNSSGYSSSVTVQYVVNHQRNYLLTWGGGLIYDADWDITWLQDVNYANTSGYVTLGGRDVTTTNGKMTWSEAMAWADGLDYAGVSNWRLPVAWEDWSPSCFFSPCPENELEHLYYGEGITPDSAESASPFINLYELPERGFWTSNEVGSYAIRIDYTYLDISANNQNEYHHAWAVHDGNVARDLAPPDITITTPAHGATYQIDEEVIVDFSVTDNLTGVANVTSTLPNGWQLDTCKEGVFSFTVQATDNAGNSDSVTVHYKVAATNFLIDRGGGLIYDADKDITWLQDVNYANTSGYVTPGSRDVTTTNGKMTWSEAMAWADGLDYAGVSNWRLPVAWESGSPPCYFSPCPENELGHLYYDEGVTPDSSQSASPFINLYELQARGFWTGTADGNYKIRIDYTSLDIGASNENDYHHAWAVHDGDIGAIVDVSGTGYNYPETGFSAAMSMDVNSTSLGASWLNYYYSKLILILQSTSITAVINNGNTVIITGEGMVNGIAGYTFVATVADSCSDLMGIVIYNSDGSIYFQTDPLALSSGDFAIKIGATVQYDLTTDANPQEGGSISPDCSNICTYDDGTLVVLTANENSGYSFGDWSDCDNPSNNICTMNMDNNKALTANFNTCLSPIRVDDVTPVYYQTLQQAIDSAEEWDSITIQAQSQTLTEDLTFNSNISVTLEGGYACDYGAFSWDTTLIGNITINNGTVEIEGFEISD
jgi:hypothetical protein